MDVLETSKRIGYYHFRGPTGRQGRMNILLAREELVDLLHLLFNRT